MASRHMARVWTDPKTGHAYTIRLTPSAEVLGFDALDDAPALDRAGLLRLHAALTVGVHLAEDVENLPADERGIRAGFTGRRDDKQMPIEADYWGVLHAVPNDADADRLATARLLREADDSGKRRVPYLKKIDKKKGLLLSENAANKRANAAIQAGYAPVAPGYEGRSRHASRHDPESAPQNRPENRRGGGVPGTLRLRVLTGRECGH